MSMTDAQRMEWDRQAKERGVPMVLAEAEAHLRAGASRDMSPEVFVTLRRELPIYSPRHPDHGAWKMGRAAAEAQASSALAAISKPPRLRIVALAIEPDPEPGQ